MGMREIEIPYREICIGRLHAFGKLTWRICQKPGPNISKTQLPAIHPNIGIRNHFWGKVIQCRVEPLQHTCL